MNNISTSSGLDALNRCAIECALRRQSRKCKVEFGGFACNGCKWNVMEYIDADPRQAKLFMIQADVKAAELDAVPSAVKFVLIIMAI